MLFRHFIALILYLRFMGCASIASTSYGIESDNVEIEEGNIESTSAVPVIQKVAIVKKKCNDMLTFFIDLGLFQNILEYVAKSPGKMAMVAKRFQEHVENTKESRFFYEGLRWAMPEIVNLYRSEKGSEELLAEMNVYAGFKYVQNELKFAFEIYRRLIIINMFKKISNPVLRYLFRIIFTSKNQFNGSSEMKRRLYYYAAKNGFYEVMYDLKYHNNIKPFFLQSAQAKNVYNTGFHYYNWVYDNPRACKYFLETMNSQSDESEISDPDMKVWCAVCIHRHAPESYYFGYLLSDSFLFFNILHSYLVRFSLITIDAAEMAFRHSLIMGLIDKYLLRCQNTNLSTPHPSIKFINDVRFGPEDPEIGLKLNNIDQYGISMLIVAASKANKKDLVYQLSNHPKFDIRLFGKANSFEYENPHSFKVLFDIIETNSESPSFLKERVFELMDNLHFLSLINEKFKIRIETTVSNSIRFIIESPAEYRDLGFASYYNFIVEVRNFKTNLFIQKLQIKLFNDSADSGEEEFEKFIKTLDRQFFEHSVINYVSYKVIELLLKNKDLIRILKVRLR